MRVVHTGDGEAHAGGLELEPGVRGVVPAALDKRGAHALPRQVHVRGFPLRPGEVLQRVDRPRRPVVVGAEDEGARPVEQRAERVEHPRHPGLVGEVVAGVDHQVRLERVQPGDERHLLALPRNHVQVRDVEDPERVAPPESPGCKQRQLDLSELEVVAFGVGPRSRRYA